MPKKDLIIIGAGLSGLYTATLLQDDFNIIILEARERVGGRILTKEGHDLGPSWIWPHQNNILALIDDLGLELFAQYSAGAALYDAPQGVQRFVPPDNAPSARVRGGLGRLIRALSSKLPEATIRLNQAVNAITQTAEGLSIQTSEYTYQADYVISTLSPRLACRSIKYAPELPDDMSTLMLQTPTWMGHTAKCVIEFTEAFWRKEGLSGFVFSHIGPLGEIHDASTHEKAALFGFIHHNASSLDLENNIKAQIRRLFPDIDYTITTIHCTDWRDEKFTSTSDDRRGLSAHPDYGLRLTHFEEKMFFAGTETAYDNGGYLEGAVISAKDIAKRLRSIIL